MKTNLVPLFLASVICTMLLVCFPTKGQNISAAGVGPVKVGQNYSISEEVLNRSKLPEKYLPLYDEISCDRDQFSGNFQMVCRLDGALSLLVFSDDDDKVECFTVLTDKVKTKEGLSTASTAAQILAACGKLQKMPVTGNTLYRLTLNGVYFLFSNADVSGGKIKSDARPYAISNTLYGGISEEELAIW